MVALIKCCFDPGKLKHLVQIVQPVKTRDDLGHVNESWRVIANVRAAIEPASTIDKWQAAQVQTTVTHKITIRYRAGITGEMQMWFRGRVFQIIGQPMNPEEINQWLICMCDEAG